MVLREQKTFTNSIVELHKATKAEADNISACLKEMKLLVENLEHKYAELQNRVEGYVCVLFLFFTTMKSLI